MTQLTPTNSNERGAQLSIHFSTAVQPIADALTRHGVICDERKPSVLRVSPAPLYNSFTDVYRVVQVLREVIDSYGSSS